MLQSFASSGKAFLGGKMKFGLPTSLPKVKSHVQFHHIFVVEHLIFFDG